MVAVADIELDPTIFGITPNQPVLHQVITAQLAAARSGTQSTKTRAEVRGGGKKPWRQKGTGRARQGSSRAPHWTGGGVTHAPKPRSYTQKTPKKMVQLALRSALSDRAADSKVVVIEDWGLADPPSTKAAKAILAELHLEGKVLVVVSHEDHIASLSFRNLPDVHVLLAGELNAYDVLCSDFILFTRATLPGGQAAAAAPAPAEEPVAAADAEPAADTETQENEA
jgi:large subunit ribosomal protein L4